MNYSLYYVISKNKMKRRDTLNTIHRIILFIYIIEFTSEEELKRTKTRLEEKCQNHLMSNANSGNNSVDFKENYRERLIKIEK
jgi:hypothetical protein